MGSKKKVDLGNELSGCFKMVKSLFVDAESPDEHQFMPQGMYLKFRFVQCRRKADPTLISETKCIPLP